ncbi:hypothetical protein [Amycolatopsis sp. NPDC004079]|uniref:hypothetical protein n=1 Tax=Amycolatopsis sp. NPDC004079 TaxID=3154549 RepID=UPI0033B28C0B
MTAAPEERPKPIDQYRDIHEILDQIQLRPEMWLRQRSLRDLQSILFGYGVALDVHGLDEEFALWPVGSFARWIEARFGWSMAAGWAVAIEKHADCEEPLNVFFRLLDEYRAS